MQILKNVAANLFIGIDFDLATSNFPVSLRRTAYGAKGLQRQKCNDTPVFDVVSCELFADGGEVVMTDIFSPGKNLANCTCTV